MRKIKLKHPAEKNKKQPTCPTAQKTEELVAPDSKKKKKKRGQVSSKNRVICRSLYKRAVGSIVTSFICTSDQKMESLFKELNQGKHKAESEYVKCLLKMG